MESTSGYCFSLGSGIFSWCSKKQEIVAKSTAKDEFIATLAVVNQVVLWLKKFLIDLNMEQKETTKVFVDNQVIIGTSHNPIFQGKQSILTLCCFS